MMIMTFMALGPSVMAGHKGEVADNINGSAHAAPAYKSIQAGGGWAGGRLFKMAG